MSVRGHLYYFKNYGFLLVFGCLILFSISIAPTVVSGSLETEIGTQDSTEITECTKIEEPGKYALSNDIVGTEDDPCIEITGTNSVILNGNGFSISNARIAVNIHNSSNVSVKNLSVNESDRVGISIRDSEDVDVYETNISHNGEGQWGQNSSIHIAKTTNIDIYNNTVVNSSGIGINPVQTKDADIYENVVLNAHWSIFTYNSTNIVIDSNTIKNPKTLKNPDTAGNAIAGHYSTNVTVTNNYINQSRYGIEAKPNSNNFLIRGNTIKNTVLCGIDAEGHNQGENAGSVSDIVIEDNVLKNADFIKANVSTSDIIIRNNTVLNSPGHAAFVVGNDGNVEIYNNTFINSTWSGMWVAEVRGNLSIYNNEFREMGTGIRFINSTNILVERNQFSEVSTWFNERNSSGIEYDANTVIYKNSAESTKTPTPTPTLTATPSPSPTPTITVTTTPTPTTSPTPTQTEADPKTTQETDVTEPGTMPATQGLDSTETPGQPGFGRIMAVIALAAIGLLSKWRWK